MGRVETRGELRGLKVLGSAEVFGLIAAKTRMFTL